MPRKEPDPQVFTRPPAAIAPVGAGDVDDTPPHVVTADTHTIVAAGHDTRVLITDGAKVTNVVVLAGAHVIVGHAKVSRATVTEESILEAAWGARLGNVLVEDNGYLYGSPDTYRREDHTRITSVLAHPDSNLRLLAARVSNLYLDNQYLDQGVDGAAEGPVVASMYARDQAWFVDATTPGYQQHDVDWYGQWAAYGKPLRARRPIPKTPIYATRAFSDEVLDKRAQAAERKAARDEAKAHADLMEKYRKAAEESNKVRRRPLTSDPREVARVEKINIARGHAPFTPEEKASHLNPTPSLQPSITTPARSPLRPPSTAPTTSIPDQKETPETMNRAATLITAHTTVITSDTPLTSGALTGVDICPGDDPEDTYEGSYYDIAYTQQTRDPHDGTPRNHILPTDSEATVVITSTHDTNIVVPQDADPRLDRLIIATTSAYNTSLTIPHDFDTTRLFVFDPIDTTDKYTPQQDTALLHPDGNPVTLLHGPDPRHRVDTTRKAQPFFRQCLDTLATTAVRDGAPSRILFFAALDLLERATVSDPGFWLSLAAGDDQDSRVPALDGTVLGLDYQRDADTYTLTGLPVCDVPSVYPAYDTWTTKTLPDGRDAALLQAPEDSDHAGEHLALVGIYATGIDPDSRPFALMSVERAHWVRYRP